MPFGYAPFVRDYLDTLIERRLGRRPVPVESVLRSDALSPFEAPSYPVGEASIEPRRPSLLRRAAAEGFGDTGQESFGAGIQAGLGQPDFLSALASSFGTSLGYGAKLRRASRAGEEKGDLEERRVRAAERQAKAAEDRANRPGASRQTRYDVLSDEARFLGEQGVDTRQYYGTRGLGGRSGGAGGRLTDLDKVAQGLVHTGRAPDLETAYVIARTLAQQPQQVGSITRTVSDPNNLFNATTVRLSVARRINPETGDFELIDERGNLLTDNDLKTFRADPAGFSGGTGGYANEGPADFSDVQSGSNSTAPAPRATTAAGAPAPGATATPPAVPPAAAAVPGSDFATNQPGVTEEQIVQALLSPAVDVNLVRLYAAGRGPMGNSTRIKQAAAAALSRAR